MTRNWSYLGLVAAFCSVVVGCAPPNRTDADTDEQALLTEVTIDVEGITPAIPVAGRSMYVFFGLSNNGGVPRTGWVGATVRAPNGTFYDTDVSADRSVGSLPAGGTLHDHIMIHAPIRATPNAEVKVYYYEALLRGDAGQYKGHLADSTRSVFKVVPEPI